MVKWIFGWRATALLAIAVSNATASAGLKNSDCLECHSEKTLSKTNAAGGEVSLFVDIARLTNSVHKTNTCASCHSGITEKHPDDNVPSQPVSCVTCHKRQAESYGASVHGQALKAGRSAAATCRDCHDSHDIIAAV
jgi:nitrate/TMAO reductase-like tetraheme cytochrome c subunit